MADSHQELLAQAIKYLAGSLGHELNNNLTVILGNCQIARKAAAEPTIAMDHIEKAAQQIASGISGLTAMASRFGSARRKCDLGEELRSVVPQLEQTCADKFAPGCDLEAARGVSVRMDPDRLPLVLYLGVFCLSGEKPVSLSVSAVDPGAVRLSFIGPGSRIRHDLRERASSESPDILLGEDEIAIGLSMLKAFAHRCQGTLEIRVADGATDLTLVLPQTPDLKSFLD